MSAGNVVRLPQESASWPRLIPDGVYTVAFQKYAITTRFGRGSLEVWFTVTDYGPHFQHPLCRYYKVRREGKQTFRASPNSAYAREFAAVFGRLPPRGQAGLSHYQNVVVRARVRAVAKDHKQKGIPDAARYSVIDELISKASP